MSTAQFAHFTLKGSKPYNEDAANAYTMDTPLDAHADTPPYVHVITVADGHGVGGEGLECAVHCQSESKRWVTTLLTRSDWKTMDWTHEATLLTAHLHSSYREVCVTKKDYGVARIVDEQGIVRKDDEENSAVHSGSTFSMALVFPWEGGYRRVTIQVGDSDIFVNGECIECDHSPLSKTEWTRLQSYPEASRLQMTFNSARSSLVFLPNGEYNPAHYNAKWGATPWRWDSGISPANAKYQPGTYAKSPAGTRDITIIGMTRSIGDFYAHPQGMTTEPHVTVADHPTCPSVFIASDGAFDSMNTGNQWVSAKKPLGGVDLSAKYAVAQQSGKTIDFVVETLVHDLNGLAKELFGQSDDISVAVLLP